MNRVFIIFSKEFREVFRDKRTIISVVVSPLIVTPALFALMGLIVHNETKKEAYRVYDIGMVGGSNAPELASAIDKLAHLRVVPTTMDEAEARVAKRKLAAAVILPPDAARLGAQYRPVPVSILMDPGDEGSQAAANDLSKGIAGIGEHVISARLAEKKLSPQFATPYSVSEVPIKTGGSTASLVLASILPYILVISSFGGSIYASFDQVAGEKERGTLETLLVSPASRREIVLGKFAAVTAVCLISSVLSVIGVILSFVIPSSMLALINKGGLHLSGAAIVVSLLMLLPLAVLFAGTLLAVSTFARNQKEAQTYITPILLMVMVPVMVSIFTRSDVSRAAALVPILGASIIIKEAFSGTFDPAFMVMAFTSSVVYGAIALMISTHLFEKESVLIKA